MPRLFYFDTSIWLDLFENRNEPNLPKGNWTKELIKNIIKNGDKIMVSEAIKNELLSMRYSKYDIENKFFSLKHIIKSVYSTKKQFGKARDLSKKRNVPLLDALHALIARDNHAILITLDQHFNILLDIIKPKKPQDFI